jgi:LL-diaminopimelate aminotransferase
MSEESYIQQLFAQRIGGASYGKSTEIYKFEKIKRAKAAAKAASPEVPLIDMGVGEPDEMAFPEVVDALCEAARKPENRGYADNGGQDFKEAAARYMQTVFGVALDPSTEIVHSIGSKSALSILPAAFIDPTDVVLMTTPGYPVLGTHAKWYGGEVYNYPLLKENAFLPELESAPADVLKRAKLLVINYPNNPTGASATPEFFARAIAFARQHNLILVQDAAYASLVFDGHKPLSILQMEGAKDVAIELHSLSKSYNMTGWRIGFVCGNPLVIKAFSDCKDNSDSGQFLGIQEAASKALALPAITEAIAEKYSRRMNLLVKALQGAGFCVTKPGGSFFLYTAAPKSARLSDGSQRQFDSGEAFSQFLIRELLISTVPWDDAGSYIRFSVTFAARTRQDEEEVITEIESRLRRCAFAW